MEIITINVGQGAFVVVRDHMDAIIVDTRIPAAGDGASEYVKGALAQAVAGRNVQGLMLTGFDADHADVSGVAIALRKYRPAWIMYPKYYKDTAAARNVFGVINGEVAARKTTLSPLTRYSIRLDRVERRLFVPGKLARGMAFELFSPHPEDMTSSNDCSLVVKISSPTLSYLVTGDAEVGRWDTIARLFRANLKSDVMAAPHHGSRNGAHDGALGFVQPDTVLISAGIDNSYGHPHPEALAAFRRVRAKVYSTHEGDSLYTYRDARGGVRTDAGRISR